VINDVYLLSFFSSLEGGGRAIIHITVKEKKKRRKGSKGVPNIFFRHLSCAGSEER